MATNAQLSNPRGVFVSSNDEVYIADYHNHRIRKILRNGNIVTIAGNGQYGYSGDNGPATNAQLNNPSCVFVSSNDEVYIADCGNHRIRKILKNGNIVTIAGNGQKGYSGDNGPATNAQLYNPYGVFVSSNDEVYIADCTNHRIRKILKNGNIVTIAGNGQKGYSGDNGPATNAQFYYPCGVFVSSNDEVYIADEYNQRVRKILKNGNIITIAGNGQKGYSGDNGPATNAQFYYPSGVFVSSNDEVYIADNGNHRIRKILRNGNIITIAGNGQEGYSGDNGSVTNAQLNNPSGIFVSPNDEVYIADRSNHRIRKILRNGNIITIAGNGQEGYSGDSVFDFLQYPHIGGYIETKPLIFKLKKHSRDLLFKSSIYGFIPLIEIVSPLFCKHILKNETLISSLNPIQQEILQKLIDSLIYIDDESEMKFNNNEILNVLYILGLFKNNEFIPLKKSLISEFIQSVTIENLCLKWEEVEVLSQSTNQLHLENYILEYLNNYCVEFSAIQMKSSEGFKLFSAPTPIITKNSMNILQKISLSNPTPIILNEKTEIEPMNIERLYNDKKTSDLKIEISPNKYLHCHKTILSSSSSLFDALFNSGSVYADFNDNIFIPDVSDDLELLEIVIKTCYGIPVENIPSEKIICLVDMAMKHEMNVLVKYCKDNFKITIDNYFDIVSACENYLELEFFESFYDELLKFGIHNRKQLFNDNKQLMKLAQKLLADIVLKFSQDF